MHACVTFALASNRAPVRRRTDNDKKGLKGGREDREQARLKKFVLVRLLPSPFPPPFSRVRHTSVCLNAVGSGCVRLQSGIA